MRTQWIRIYSNQQDENLHTFYAGFVMGGISDRVASYEVDETSE